jgi:hypothetical protein
MDVNPVSVHYFERKGVTSMKILTLTIDEQGVTYVKPHGEDPLFELGNTITKRASHVEPEAFWLRVAFRFLRLFGDNTRVAAWTRGWRTLWRINTRPVGGPILRFGHIHPRVTISGGLGHVYHWADRNDAIAAEVKFLNEFFLTHNPK